MIYIEYHKYKNRFNNAQRQYNDIVKEKEELFSKTQPQATKYDKEKVNGGKIGDAFDDYIIIKENKKIDERLAEARSILDDRERLLKVKEDELRKSKDWNDIIYKYYFLDNLSTYKIEKRVPMDQSTIWRHLNEIKNNLH